MKLLILPYHQVSLWSAPLWFSERLRQDFLKIDVVHLSTYEEIEAQIADAEIIMGWSLRPEQFSAAGKLRWIHSPAAAVNQLMFPELIASDVILTNGRDVHGPTVAEHVIALIFALAKKLPLAMRFQGRSEWGQDEVWRSQPPPREITGATLGLVGLGSIGREVASRASDLGMRVIATRERMERPKPENVAEVFATAQLEAMLSQSDYVVLAAPLTASTRGMMDATRIAAMKADAYLINVGRGPLLDEHALLQALRDHKIAGAALDVFETEPLAARLAAMESGKFTYHPAHRGIHGKDVGEALFSLH